MNSKNQTRLAYFCLGFFVLLLGATIPQWVTTLYTYDSVAEMAAHHNPAGFFRSTYARGYYTPGDGGGGMFTVTNSITSTNLGGRIKALLGGGTYSFDAVGADVSNVRRWGAKGDGTFVDTPAITSRYDALSSTLGGEIFLPDGTWKYNLTINKPNVVLRGTAHYMDGYSDTVNMVNRMIPAIATNYVVQVGNDSAIVRGVVIQDCNLYGAGTGAGGLYMAGGAFQCRVQNSTITQFTNCVKVLGGTVKPASLIWFDHVDVQPANVVGARGYLIVQTSNYPTSWTTAIDIVNSHGQGPSTASDSFWMENDSVGVYLSNTYADVSDGHGIKVSKTYAQTPFLYCSLFSLDATPGTGAALESYSNNRYFTDQISGQFSISGKWKLLDGTLLTPPQGALRQNAALLYPQAFGTINIVEFGNVNFTGQNWTNQQIGVVSDNLYFRSEATIKSQSALGSYQLDGEWSTGLSQQKLFDPVNNKTVTIKGLNGSLLLVPAAGGAVKFCDSTGAVKAQINGTGGGFFLQALPASSSGLYTDSNQQIQAAPTGTATLDFASTAAQTSSELTITATGAAVGDPVVLSTPATANANSCYTARVTAANTVTVKFNNYSAAAIDPASGSFKVIVMK